MWWLILPLLFFIAILILSIYAPAHKLPLYLTAPLVISIYIPLSIVVLVPADLESIGISESVRFVLWRIIYWSSFFLTWLILPSLQFYFESGYFEPMIKIKDAIKSNLRHQLILAVTGIVGLLYMGASTGSLTNLKALAIALSYSYALVLCIWLLGHGLVTVPRDVWNSLPAPQLKLLYSKAHPVCDNYSDALGNYHDAAGRIIALIPIKTPQYADWIDELVDNVRASSLGYPTNSRHSISTSELNDTLLASLSKRISRERARAIRYRADWIKLLEDCAFYQDIQAGKGEFRYYSSRLPPNYFIKVRPWLVRIGAILLTLTSLVIVQSELLMGTRYALLDLTAKSTEGVLKVLCIMAPLGYMCFVTGKALSSVRVFNLYGLVYHHTDPSSLLFYAMYACRLAVPLSYNFLMMSSRTSTVFQEFLGKNINLTPLGKYFNEILPRLVVLFMALTYFGVYQAVQDYLGFLGDAVEAEGDGYELVDRALNDPRFKWSLEQTRLEV